MDEWGPGNDPFARLRTVPPFQLTSTDVAEGTQLPAAQMSGIFGVRGGRDVSPALTWSGAPEHTASFLAMMYDPDAPTMAGFWHWALADIPASTTHLPSDIGNGTAELPGAAFHLPNDARQRRFIGGAPPPGDAKHRYFVVVHALDIEHCGVDRDTTPSLLVFSIYRHIIGRGVIKAWAELPAATD